MSPRTSCRFAALVLFLGSALSGASVAAPTEPASVTAKAALLYELARFVTWPGTGSATAPGLFIIGILGDDPFGSELDSAIRSKRLHGLPVSVRRFRTLDDVDPCQLLYVGRNKARLMPAVLEFLDEAPTLTVGESDNFAADGGMVQLLEHADRVGFEVNLAAAQRARLQLSSELLRIAERILPSGIAARPG